MFSFLSDGDIVETARTVAISPRRSIDRSRSDCSGQSMFFCKTTEAFVTGETTGNGNRCDSQDGGVT